MNTIVDFNESNKFVQTEMLFSDFFLSIPLWRINESDIFMCKRHQDSTRQAESPWHSLCSGKEKSDFMDPKDE